MKMQKLTQSRALIFYMEIMHKVKQIYQRQFICAHFGKSFRTKKEKELIKIDKENCFVEVEFEKSDREGKITLEIEEGKKYAVNGIKIKRLSELLR